MDLRKLKEKASESFAKGKFAKAAEAYDEYCRADPKDLQARLRLGDAWAKVGKKDKAIEAYAWAAEGFAKDGFLPRAIAASKLILELDPAHKGVQKMLADLYARKTSKSSAAARPPPPAPAPKNGNGEAPAAAAPAPAATKVYVSPPKKGSVIDPNAAPSPTNRADAIDLPEYEIPDETVATAGSTFVPMAEKGPTPTRNLNAIEIEDLGGPQQRGELEKVELDVALTGMSAPPPPPPPAPAAAEIPPPAPSAPPLELEVVAGAEEGEEVPIAGTPVYDLDDQLADVPPRPAPPQLPVELAKPLPPPPSAPAPVPQPSAPIYELEVMETVGPDDLEEVVPLTEAIEQSVGPKTKPVLEVIAEKPSLEVVSEQVEGELELVEVGGEAPQVPPEPPAPEPPPESKLLGQPPGLKPKRVAEAEMSMRLEAISEPFGADEPQAPAAAAPEAVAAPPPPEPPPAPPAVPEPSRAKPKTDPEAWAAPVEAAPAAAGEGEPSPSAPRIWIPGADEQSFESLGDELKPAAADAQTDLERGLEIFSSFEAADFLPTATRPAAPSEAARVAAPPPPPADAPAEQSAATRRRMTFTELELEGDSLLHAVETAAAVGATERGELDTPPHEESMEEIEEGRPESGALPKIPLFSDLPEDAFIALFERCPLRRPTAGEVIIQQGSLGDAFYVICSGSVKVYRIDGERKREIATLEEGAFFGEMALLSGSPRTASVEASGDECQLLEISALILTELSSKHPPVASALKKFCRQRLLQNVMASAPLFQPFSKGDRRDLVQKFRARDVNKGEVLIREGHSSDGMYVILSGEVEVRVGKTTVASLKEGDIFGEMSLLTKTAATASCVSAKRTSLLRLPKDDFDRLIMSHPQVLVLVSELTDARTKMNAALATPAMSPGSAPMV